MTGEEVVKLVAELLNACGLDGCDTCNEISSKHWRMMLAIVLYLIKQTNSSSDDRGERADE